MNKEGCTVARKLVYHLKFPAFMFKFVLNYGLHLSYSNEQSVLTNKTEMIALVLSILNT